MQKLIKFLLFARRVIRQLEIGGISLKCSAGFASWNLSHSQQHTLFAWKVSLSLARSHGQEYESSREKFAIRGPRGKARRAKGHFCAAHYFIPVRVKVCSKQPRVRIAHTGEKCPAGCFIPPPPPHTVLWPPIFQGMGVKFKLITPCDPVSEREKPGREWYYRLAKWPPSFYLQRMAALRKS